MNLLLQLNDMKKLLFILVLCISFTGFAQKDRHEKIKALKAAHITEALNLSTVEAEKFWPIYNTYEENMHELRRKERSEIYNKLKDGGLDTMSDQEANKLIDQALELKQQDVSYRIEMLNGLRKAISPKKVIRLKKAEDDFKKQLLQRYKGRKGDKR